MPILGSLSAGSLDREWNAALTQLRNIYAMGRRLYQNTLLDELAIVDMSSMEPLTQLGLTIDGSNYQIKALGAETDYQDAPPAILSECGYKRVDLFGLEWLELADPLTKQTLIQSMPDLGGKPVQMPLLELLKLLNQNSGDGPIIKWGDGTKTLFNTAHVIDPKGSPSATAGNKIVQPATSAGWDNVLQAIMTRQDPGSKPSKGQVYMPNRDLTGKNLVIYTGHTGVASTLAKIFDPQSNWAVAVGAAAASETRKVFAQASIQYLPEMSMYGTITNYCYIAVNNTPLRAVYARIPHKPKVDPIERIPSQHKQRVKGWQTFGITGAYPFALYKWLFS